MYKERAQNPNWNIFHDNGSDCQAKSLWLALSERIAKNLSLHVSDPNSDARGGGRTALTLNLPSIPIKKSVTFGRRQLAGVLRYRGSTEFGPVAMVARRIGEKWVNSCIDIGSMRVVRQHIAEGLHRETKITKM